VILRRSYLLAVVAAVSFQVASAQAPQGQAAGQSTGQPTAPKKDWKDRAEYDLYSAADKAVKAKEFAKGLEALDQWATKYASSDYKDVRLVLYFECYRNTGKVDKMLDTGAQLLAIDPKNLSVLYTMTFMGRPAAGMKTTPEMLDATEKAAKTLIGNIDSLRPANLPDADWKKTATAAVAEAHITLGAIAQQRKDYEGAEKEFKEAQKENPSTGQVPYFLGTVILAQKKPETYAEALFFFARAAAYDGTGALNPAGRKEVLAYLTKIYITYHGSKDDLDQLLATAKANPMPPAGFAIKTGAEIDAEKAEKFKADNPQLALWLEVKKQLTAADGEQYFAEHMKDAAVPKLKGVLVSTKPAKNPKELVLGIADPKTPEVTLKLTEGATLPGSVDPGAEISFEGIPVAFTKEPFNVTFDVEKAKIEGWTGKATPPARKAAPKKAATKK